jgi:hypothetical protein
MSHNEEEKVINDDESHSNTGLNPPPPWLPYIPALIALFLGIGGGVAVSYINLRRFGKERSDTILPLGGIAGLSLAISFLMPSSAPSFVSYLVIALIFFVYQKNEFDKWRRYHQDTEPDKWWTAIGWGLLGLVIYGTIITFIFIFFDIPPYPQPRNLRPLQ